LPALLDRVRLSIERNHLLSVGETVVVGVSGGPDSLCLLHALCQLKQEYRLALHVAHLHHGLRGADADADAGFVQVLAADWGLPCTLERADVHSLAREQHLSIEEAARRARYTFLWEVAETVGAGIIAVGHNADDQSETVLMHWLRGSGLAGLRGMLPRTSLSDYRLLGILESPGPTSSVWLVRPLLEVTRDEIEAYCQFNALAPRFDQSNLDTTYFRNWLRREVFPLLAQHNPNVKEVIRRSALVLADDYALLRSVLEETWPQVVVEQAAGRIVFDLKAWRHLPTSLKRSTLREAIHCLRRSLRNINFLHVENAHLVARDGTTGEQATLPQGLVLTVGYDRLTISEAGDAEPQPNWPLLSPKCAPVAVTIPGTTPLRESGWSLVAEVVSRADLPAGWESNAEPWRAFLDTQAVGRSLWLRTRQPGDRFQPLGLGGHSVKLADFLTNEKVPLGVRDLLPLLDGKSGIAWVCGHRLDDRARVRDGTREVLILRFVPDWV
jgi:tRNA(Ile)-lysidine synthase